MTAPEDLGVPGLVAAAAVMAALAALLAAAIVARRYGHRRAARRRSRIESRVRPAVSRLVRTGDLDAPWLAGSSRADRAAFERIVIRLLGKVRGEQRDLLVGVLDGCGALERARRATRSRSALRRARAADLLGAAGWRPASPDLVRLCHDRSIEVRSVAARALGNTGDAAAAPVLLSLIDPAALVPATTAGMALARLGEIATPALRGATADPNPRVRALAADVLGVGGAVPATAQLVALATGDVDEGVRSAAVRALGRIGSPRALGPLVECLRTGPATVQVEAAAALGNLGSPDAIPALVGGLSGRPALVRQAAAALAQLGTPGLAALDEVARGPHHPAGSDHEDGDRGVAALAAAAAGATRVDLGARRPASGGAKSRRPR